MGEARKFFEESVLLETDICILWPFHKLKGRGMVRIGGMKYASREALFRRKGSPPKDKPNALHLCRNSSCFNYRHLYWGDQDDNHRDQISEGTFTTTFTESYIHWIRRQFSLGYTPQQVANHLQVPRETIKNIQIGMRYRWVPIQEPYIPNWRDLS